MNQRQRHLASSRGALRGNPFFLFAPRRFRRQRLISYIHREHQRGRALTDILNDHYLANLMSKAERERLLEQPELIRALADDYHPR